MSKLTITNLTQNGANLFADSESFLMALNDENLDSINGGRCGCDPIFRDKETNPIGMLTVVCPPPIPKEDK